MEEIAVKIGGPAGSGVMSLGKMVGKLFQLYGWHIIIYDEHPSLIVGGHNISYVRASTSPIYAHRNYEHILVALDKPTYELHHKELKEPALIVSDESIASDLSGNVVASPLSKIANDLGSLRYYNSAAFGVVAKLLGAKKQDVKKVIEKTFGKKGEKVVKTNQDAALKAYDSIDKSYFSLKKLNNKFMLIGGNDAASLGAIKAGIKYLGQYPMTPASSILSTIAKYEKSKKIVVKQTEDELAAMNSIIGAAFAGARAMTATSGGGFALMTEALGMAGMAEVPIVVIESQRGSPSTGMPTHTEQGDLRFVMHASQGEFPRVVMAPGDVEEAYYMVFEAFNLAELIQSPVIVLMDKYLASTIQSVPVFKTNLMVDRGKLLSEEQASKIKEYKRYEVTEDGTSWRALPSYPNCMHVASSYEHDETGFTTEDSEERIKQMNKRMKKLALIPKEVYAPKFYGNRDADVRLICWGSTKLPCLEAQQILKEKGIDVLVVHYPFIVPFPYDETVRLLSQTGKRNIVVEQNYLAQFRGVIREQTGFYVDEVILRYDGREVTPEEIVEKVVNNG
ncbi:MAG: 2-oxoacid:acceptor oxidoreductase subunit alpha [Candidatus Nanohaloarchaeota archaeon]|nr:2-oxoacid:acceptor oxidoreductase subunit alpha [Candidatus Nanohaloarchaeota archaeon]